MHPERRKQLERDPKQSLTAEECRAGYHFCQDWDGMVVGPDDPEAYTCLCFRVSGNPVQDWQSFDLG